jgi:hypothetical protein
MDLIEAAADFCIRRALAFAALAIMTVMLALSFDMALSFRSGGDLVALCALALLVAAWRAADQDPRDSETWWILTDWQPDLARSLSRKEAQKLLARALRRRLLWHAERVGLVAVTLWGLFGLVYLNRLAA